MAFLASKNVSAKRTMLPAHQWETPVQPSRSHHPGCRTLGMSLDGVAKLKLLLLLAMGLSALLGSDRLGPGVWCSLLSPGLPWPSWEGSVTGGT